MEVKDVGTGTVVIMKYFFISETNITGSTSKKPMSIRDRKVHILPGGDTYRITQSNPPHI